MLQTRRTRAAVTSPTAGAQLLAEIRSSLTRLESAWSVTRRSTRPLPAGCGCAGQQSCGFVGHGSSDNAASYAVYAFGLLPGWTALRDSISLSVLRRRPRSSQSCVVALSQSGRTPDVVEYAERARAKGALTIAVTNDPDFVLADVCEAVLPLAAGSERAVAATKTYTTQIAALALLAGGAKEDGRRTTGIQATAELMREPLPEPAPARSRSSR